MAEDLVADIIQWDVGNWSKCLAFWEKDIPANPGNIKFLELGGKAGGLSLWMALKGAQATYSDIVVPRDDSNALHKKYGVENNIKYESINAADIPYDGYFDIIAFKSMLGGIGKQCSKSLQLKAIQEMHRALKKGGKLFFAENLAGSGMLRMLRSVIGRKKWRYVTINEMKEFLSCFESYKFITVGFFALLGASERQRSVLSRLDSFINKIIPAHWKYIIIGVAVK